MLKITLMIVSGMLALALLMNMVRLFKGPDPSDRILALDTLYINSIGLILVFGLYRGTGLYFEAAMLIAMLGFVSTAALCKYLLRGDIIE